MTAANNNEKLDGKRATYGCCVLTLLTVTRLKSPGQIR